VLLFTNKKPTSHKAYHNPWESGSIFPTRVSLASTLCTQGIFTTIWMPFSIAPSFPINKTRLAICMPRKSHIQQQNRWYQKQCYVAKHTYNYHLHQSIAEWLLTFSSGSNFIGDGWLRVHTPSTPQKLNQTPPSVTHPGFLFK
jgi:hypothetical protein